MIRRDILVAKSAENLARNKETVPVADAPRTTHSSLADDWMQSKGPAIDTSLDLGSQLRSLPAADVDANQRYPQLRLRLDREHEIFWQWMVPTRPCFTHGLLRDMRRAIEHIAGIGANCAAPNGEVPFRYLVTGSRIPTIFNLGGDLREFIKFIRQRNLDALRRYAHACIAVQYPRGTNMGLPIVSISLVQGDALGGGFEAALASDLIIAEQSAKFGFPEVLFGLFPGMGAYSFLSRRIGPIAAERMIMSGKVYRAAELAELGVIDVVVEDGGGEQAVYDFIRKERRRAAVRRALYQIRRRVNSVTEAELLDITDLWAQTACKLGEVHLRTMERLSRAQDRRWASIRSAAESKDAV